MNCYDFELNISAYIEGELKQIERDDFSQHKDTCKNCEEKLMDISKLMEDLPNLMRVKTSSHFDQILHAKIREIDNRGPSVLKRLLEMKPLGFEPVPALGFSLAMVMIVSASYLLLNPDVAPIVDEVKAKQHLPTIMMPDYNLPQTMADSDTSVKSDTKYPDMPIKTVSGKKSR